MWKFGFITVVVVAVSVNADLYVHNPRGSNNRLDGQNRERQNGNRMFDSQNNDRGGYNVGGDKKRVGRQEFYDGRMYYYPGSELPIEWTNQHSCGEANTDCQLIIQYMCDDNIRDGITTRTIPENNNQCQNRNCNIDMRYGMNEDIDSYHNCKYRERNKGLFTADQDLDGDTAIYTRQNPGGTRRGLECPEERDYYPYWHPTPWKDIAVLTNNPTRCQEFHDQSQNVAAKFSCVPPCGYMEAMVNNDRNKLPTQYRKNLPLTQAECEKITFPIGSQKKGVWTRTQAHGVPPPRCIVAPKSRDNQNGNGIGAFPNMFNWTIPDLPHKHCVLRMRYNISTSDVPLDTDASMNAENNNQATKVDIAALVGLSKGEADSRGYVFENNPQVHPLSMTGSNGAAGRKLQLQLAVNTAQFGRVFQDRSHDFEIKERPTSLEGVKIHNINVRGKRGNIVQVYPAVEYDYVPNRQEAAVGDYMHFQWTGSNRNPNNNDGQGRRGTDRSNVVLLEYQRYPEGTPGKAVPEKMKKGHWGRSYPLHLDYVDLLGLPRNDLVNLAILDPSKANRNLKELDDAPVYYDLPPRRIASGGTYHYMCTRNNNFTNRSQKGKIEVKGPSLPRKAPPVTTTPTPTPPASSARRRSTARRRRRSSRRRRRRRRRRRG